MKRLYRSRTNRMVAGVAGGLAEHFGIDPTIIRLAWVLLLLPGGLPGAFLYLLAWAIIPREPLPDAVWPQLDEPVRPGAASAAVASPRLPDAAAPASLPDVVPPAPTMGDEQRA